MKPLAIIAGILAAASIAQAQPTGSMTVIGSASGQFFVRTRRAGLSPQSLELARAPNMVTLDAPLLAVSCERIKKELLQELNMPDQWEGKIFVVVRPARSSEDPIFVSPEKLGGHWHCGVQLPDAVDRNRFMEAIVHACLLEIADRNATTRSAEIPEWLVRGFARQLVNSGGIKLILTPPTGKENGFSVTRTTVDLTDAPAARAARTQPLNPLTEAANVLRTNAPLNFDQLSWPTEDQLSSEGKDLYGCNAQLFVAELLRMSNGPAGLRATLAALPHYLNWQLAFMEGFHGTFEKPLDVEKWWALQLAAFSGRDLLHLLTPDESWKQLNAVFQFPVDVQIGEAPPMRTDITFQTILRGWSRAQQLQMVKKKLWELDVLRMRISPEFIPLVDGYREVLQEYYNKRSASPRLFAILWSLPDKYTGPAIAQLNILDNQRASLRPKPPAPVASLNPASLPGTP